MICPHMPPGNLYFDSPVGGSFVLSPCEHVFVRWNGWECFNYTSQPVPAISGNHVNVFLLWTRGEIWWRPKTTLLLMKTLLHSKNVRFAASSCCWSECHWNISSVLLKQLMVNVFIKDNVHLLWWNSKHTGELVCNLFCRCPQTFDHMLLFVAAEGKKCSSSKWMLEEDLQLPGAEGRCAACL